MIHLILNDIHEHIPVSERNIYFLYIKKIFSLLKGVRPFKCDQCEKAFTQRCSLESHQRKVHGLNHKFGHKIRRNKLYVCEDCGHTSTDPTNHYEHIKISHPYSPLILRYYDKRQFKFDSNSSSSSNNNTTISTPERSFKNDMDSD